MAYVNRSHSTLGEDGRWLHRISQSNLESYRRCPESFRQVYFGEVDDDGYTDSTALGTACHAALEYSDLERMGGTLVSAAEMTDVAFHELNQIGEWRPIKFTVGEVHSLAAKMVTAYVAELRDTYRPLRVEWGFDYPFYSDDKRDIRLVGTADVITTEYRVRDHKTSARPYKRWERQRAAIQPTVYAWALAQQVAQAQTLTNILPVRMNPAMFTYSIMLHDGTTQQVEITRTQANVEFLKSQAIQLAKQIETDPAGPWMMQDDGWYCSSRWCPAFRAGHCKGSIGLLEPYAQLETTMEEQCLSK